MRWLDAQRQGVNLVGERLYQRGHFLTWPHERKWEMLVDLDIGLVVNLWVKVDPDLSGLPVLALPMHGDYVPAWADKAARIAADWQGGAVLVHCEAGVNRSAWFCARVLMARGMSGAEALFQVAQAIGRTKINPKLKADLLKDAA